MPLSFQHTGGSSIPHPTQTGGSHTPHPSHVPAREDDHAQPDDDDDDHHHVDGDDDVLDGNDLRGNDDPSEIHVIDERFWIWPEGNS